MVVLLAILKARGRDSYCEKLYKRLGCSRTYIREVVAALERQRLIRFVPCARIKAIVLTDRGRKIAESILIIKSELLYSTQS